MLNQVRVALLLVAFGGHASGNSQVRQAETGTAKLNTHPDAPRYRYNYSALYLEDGTDIDTFGDEFPLCSASTFDQSPVDIPLKPTKYAFQDLVMVNFNAPMKRISIKNNYRYPSITVEDDNPPFIFGGPLPVRDYFILDEITFHHGGINTLGSEHTIHGEKYAMEMKMTTYNAKYKNITNAATKEDGLAVVSILFRHRYGVKNKRLDALVDALADIPSPNDKTPIRSKDISFVLPNRKGWSGNYFTYRGSLTVPPCTPNVTNIVFADPIVIGREQIRAFTKLQDETGHHMSNNSRQIGIDRTFCAFSCHEMLWGPSVRTEY